MTSMGASRWPRSYSTRVLCARCSLLARPLSETPLPSRARRRAVPKRTSGPGWAASSPCPWTTSRFSLTTGKHASPQWSVFFPTMSPTSARSEAKGCGASRATRKKGGWKAHTGVGERRISGGTRGRPSAARAPLATLRTRGNDHDLRCGPDPMRRKARGTPPHPRQEPRFRNGEGWLHDARLQEVRDQRRLIEELSARHLEALQSFVTPGSAGRSLSQLERAPVSLPTLERTQATDTGEFHSTSTLAAMRSILRHPGVYYRYLRPLELLTELLCALELGRLGPDGLERSPFSLGQLIYAVSATGQAVERF